MPNFRTFGFLVSGLCLLLSIEASAGTRISNTPGHARRPQLAYSAGILHAVDFEAQNIVYYRSTNRGQTWSAPRSIGDGATDWNPVLSAGQGNVYIAWWSDKNVRGVSEVYLTRSRDGGVNWEAPQLLSTNDRKGSFVSSIDTTADGSRVIVSYWDTRVVSEPFHTNIYTRVSSSFGAPGSWGPEVLVSNVNRVLDFEHPIARFLPDGRISVLFQNNPLGLPQGGLPPTDIVHVLSPNGGQVYYKEPTFVSDSRPTILGVKNYPNSAIGPDGTIHAAWYETRQGRNVYYSKSSDGGLLWSEPLKVSDHKPFETLQQDDKPGRPGITVLGNRVEIYWVRPERNLDSGDGAGALFRAASTNNGASFQAASVIASAGTASHPTVATDGQQVFILYTADRGDGRTALMFDLGSSVAVPVLDYLGLALILGAFTVLLGRSTQRNRVGLAAAGLLLAGGLADQAEAQVTALPLQGGTINVLYRTNSGTLFAGSEGSGVYRSTDSGANWSMTSNGLGDLFVEGLDGDGGNMVLAGTLKGIYRTTDAGQTWRRQVRARVNAIRCQTGGQICYAATQGSGVLKSTNGGVSWASSGIAGLGSLDVNTLDLGGGRIWIGTNGQGVHVSSNAGASWTRTMNGLSTPDASFVSRIRVHPSNANIVYFGSLGELAPTALNASAGDLYVTTNAGASWQKQTSPEPFFGVLGLTFAGGRLFVGSNAIGVFASTGDPSSGQFSKILPAVHARDIVSDSTGRSLWIAIRGGGVVRSTDGGASFIGASRGMRAFTVRDISVSGQNIFVAVLGGVQRSTDGGRSFAFANTGMGTGQSLVMDVLAIEAAGEGRVYAATLHDGFYVSENDGTTWTRRDPPNTRNIRAIALRGNKDRVVVGGFQGNLYASDNGGRNWSAISLQDNKAFVSSIAVDPGNANQMLVGSFNQRSFATANGSAFAETLQPTSADYRIGIFDVLTLPALNLQIAASAEGMLNRPLSYAAGPAWTRRLGGLEDSFFTSVVSQPGNPAKLVAAAYGAGLYVSNDGGMNWRKVSGTFRSTAIQKVTAFGPVVLVGTVGDGVYQLPWP